MTAQTNQNPNSLLSQQAEQKKDGTHNQNHLEEQKNTQNIEETNPLTQKSSLTEIEKGFIRASELNPNQNQIYNKKITEPTKTLVLHLRKGQEIKIIDHKKEKRQEG